MTYEESVAYILSIPKFTTKNKPEHTKAFLRYLGNPEKKLKVFHVAGTNGKGSVCAYLNAMLRAEGKSVGLFTSPHLVKVNERICINGEIITDEIFTESFEIVLKAAGGMAEAGLPHPTFFEFLFGMAVTAFAKAEVEYVVLETGLGGRLDATNSVEHPICTVITSIGFDHMELLGGTLEEIAAEKAGIIKPEVPVLFADGDESSNRVIENTAEKIGSPCKKIGKNAFEILGIENKYIAFSCANAYYEDITWRLHNTGIYQPENAALALEAMRMIFGREGHPKLWQQALEQVTWPGRMEEVLPEIYIDGAHNLSAVERFAESVSRRETAGKMILFSAVQDKDYEEMIACLCRKVDAELYVVTHISDKRAEDTEKLKNVFLRYTNRPVLVKESVEEAWAYVTEHQENRTVYCLGSLYLAGMIKAFIDRRS